MEGGDLMTLHQPSRGGDLMTTSRQQQRGGFFGLIPKLLGLGPGEMQKQMSDPTKLQQLLMQRGGFPWALAGLSMLPMLLGKGKNDGIQNQMRTTRDPVMQRGGLSIPPALITKGLPLLKTIGIPLAMGALASVGDNVVDKIFGNGPAPRRSIQSRIGTKRRMTTTTIKRRKSAGQSLGKPRRRTHTLKRSSKKSFKTGKSSTRSKTRHHHRRGSPSSSSSLSSALLQRGKRMLHNQLRTTGRRLFEKAKTKAKSRLRTKLANGAAKVLRSRRGRQLADTPFAEKIRENINRAAAAATASPPSHAITSNSSHIGQSFNI